jgi:glycosyltransferase involved in cell wall biosynthesis
VRKIFILVENFFPAYKGGGPIQSITNLIISLQNEYEVYVVTSAYDLRSTSIMPGITPDAWMEIILPNAEKKIKVWYAEKGKPGYSLFKHLVSTEHPDVIYINGFFSYRLFLIPLMAIKNLAARPKVVICPRGMLQKGALANKSIKKKAYISFLKLYKLVEDTFWHATSDEEKDDIYKQFKNNKGIVIAMNIPKKPFEEVSMPAKSPGSLRLVYLSLIAEKKNLLFLLQLIKETQNISLDIYGPVKDVNYWGECEKMIAQMPEKVKYKGDIVPQKVQETFSKYHASILLTKGENFSHALYESLSVGRPVITSNFTPWVNLEKRNAGWNFDISNFEECLMRLDNIKQLDQLVFNSLYGGAHKQAKKYFLTSNNLDSYKKLFQ